MLKHEITIQVTLFTISHVWIGKVLAVHTGAALTAMISDGTVMATSTNMANDSRTHMQAVRPVWAGVSCDRSDSAGGSFVNLLIFFERTPLVESKISKLQTQMDKCC